MTEPLQHLFHLLELNDASFINFDEQDYDRFPVGRRRALLRAIETRAILAYDLPASLPEFLREAKPRLRLAPDKSGAPVPLGNVNNWERVLGDSFQARIVTHGGDVHTLLAPCFQANQQLQVIDPYLAPGDCKCRSSPCGCDSSSRKDKDASVETLLNLALRPDSNLEILRVATATRRWKETPKEEDARAVGQWLLDYASTKVPESCPLKELTWDLFSRQDARVHDRFLGFLTQGPTGRPPANADPPWHALSIGYGIRALRTDPEGYTCLARISEEQFDHVLRQAERHFQWGVVVRRGPRVAPRSRFNEVSNLNDGKGDWTLQVVLKMM